MFRVAVESILGVRLERGRQLRIDPRIAADWPECRVQYRLDDRQTVYDIRIRNSQGRERGVTAATLDGEAVTVGPAGAIVTLVRDGRRHDVLIDM
jgi:cyclic beta-1,2-glucan synthetase